MIRQRWERFARDNADRSRARIMHNQQAKVPGSRSHRFPRIGMEQLMRRLAVLSAVLIGAATLANPVAARERYVQRPAVVDPDMATPAAPYYRSGPGYYPWPRVGAFAT